jgi:Stage II sporulation protein E (SpoIIE)
VLALYTDGLVEQPGQDLGTGTSRLARALGESRARSLDDLGDSVLAGLGPPPVTTSPCCSPPGQAREPRGLITRSSRPALESVLVDNRRVDDLLGVDPLVFVVPPHLGRERDVVDVAQDLVLALAVPDLAAGIAAVGQDGADGVLGPRDPTAMPVPVGVVRGWAREALGGQPLGNEVDPEPARNSAKIRRATAAAGLAWLVSA